MTFTPAAVDINNQQTDNASVRSTCAGGHEGPVKNGNGHACAPNHKNRAAGETLMDEANKSAVLFYAVSAWKRHSVLSHAEWKTAFLAADAVLEMHPPFSPVSADIPHFGRCSYGHCLAIVSVAIVAAAQTNHLDSPFLEAARTAKLLAML